MTKSGPWLSWAIYLGARKQFDSFVRDVLPALPIGGDAWFFIRYGAGGPHLRVRIRPSSPSHAAAAEAFLRHHAESIAAQGIDADWHRSVSFPGGVGHPPGTVCILPYAAELARYGGPDAIGISEALFCGSSRLAVRAVTWAHGAPSRLHSHALDMMLAVAATLFDDGVKTARFFRTYSKGWEHYLRELGRRPPLKSTIVSLDAPAINARLERLIAWRRGEERAGGLTSAWVTLLRDTRRQLEQLAAQGDLHHVAPDDLVAGGDRTHASIANILGSHMHMMNNRLGFSPIDELRWAHQLTLAIGGDA